MTYVLFMFDEEYSSFIGVSETPQGVIDFLRGWKDTSEARQCALNQTWVAVEWLPQLVPGSLPQPKGRRVKLLVRVELDDMDEGADLNSRWEWVKPPDKLLPGPE